MRMRRLGKGQSVVFCIPEEITSAIQTLSGKCANSRIDVADVLRWTVSETWIDMRRSIPLWAVQGERFERQLSLWDETRHGDHLMMSEKQAAGFLEPESQSLDCRYRPCNRDAPFLHGQLERSANHRPISDRCLEFDNLNFASTQLQEEQERELAPEIQQERQVQRPPPAKPEKHHLHPDLLEFVSTGVLKARSSAYKPAFEALRNTSANAYLDVSQFPHGLQVTNDFSTTVQMSHGSRFISDTYQRPVQWVLTSTSGGAPSPGKRVAKQVVIISPYEASHLLSEIRTSRAVTIHLYAPRKNLGFSTLDKLTLYNDSGGAHPTEIPDTIRIQLNLFAGQLYINSYGEYQDLCEFLGVASVKTPDNLTVAADGFIVAGHQGTKTPFSQSPLKFLKILMSQIRTDCLEIDKTHIGKIVEGRSLHPCDFPGDQEH